MQHTLRALVLFAALAGMLPPSARAEGWQLTMQDDPAIPPLLVAVEKATQRLFLYEKHSPLKLERELTCTTGQADGDKKTTGDLRTPEGIYFVVGKLSAGLDYEMYGGIAYTLNYPNPVDKLRGKTGHGIWIHSKGHDIVPRETKGCIAINRKDIDDIGPRLVAGTAVAVAAEIATDAGGAPAQKQQPTAAEATTRRKLESRVKAWADAWSARSPKLFDFYDANSYSLAQEAPFEEFKNQKERLFKQLPWVHTTVRNIRVMQGPGYWVTWFDQYYRAPNMTSEGVRRLYWQPDAQGELRIVGMEWVPGNVGMEAQYLEGVTPQVATFIEKWRKAWEKADAKTYASFYADDAKQQGRTGATAIRQHKQQLWAVAKPARVTLSGIRIVSDANGVTADMVQTYRDASGKQDVGTKTLKLHPHGSGWRIISEDWTPHTR